MYENYYNPSPGFATYPPYPAPSSRSGVDFRQQRVRGNILHVSGEASARSVLLEPNCSAVLVDDTAPLIWIAVSDGTGYTSVTPYDIAKHEDSQQKNLNDFEDRLKRLEALYESNFGAAKPSEATAEPDT